MTGGSFHGNHPRDRKRISGAFGALANKAVDEPVTITKDGRDHLVVLSAEEYARLKRRDRRVGLASELPEEWVEAAQQARLTANSSESRHDRTS